MNTKLALRRFGQTERQRERKLRVGLSFHHKDFTKNSVFRDAVKMRTESFKSRIPFVPLSKIARLDRRLVSRKRRPFLSMSPLLNPRAAALANKAAQTQAGGAVKDIWNTEGGSLRDKFFALDHTAEVLENYRRLKENEIFNKVLFEEREKRAFLKKEARKTENLIENYDSKFANHKYFEGTEGATDFAKISAAKALFLEEKTIVKGLSAPSGESLLNENKEYARKQRDLANKRIEKLLTPRSNNPQLQKYLEERSSYETASLGETSADELALKSGEDSDKIDVLRPSTLAQSYDSEKQMAAEVALYERKIVDEYHNLDLYRAKGKSRGKISFKDLSLSENLNYIKHNLKDSQ